jgi:hypothetical protein
LKLLLLFSRTLPILYWKAILILCFCCHWWDCYNCSLPSLLDLRLITLQKHKSMEASRNAVSGVIVLRRSCWACYQCRVCCPILNQGRSVKHEVTQSSKQTTSSLHLRSCRCVDSIWISTFPSHGMTTPIPQLAVRLLYIGLFDSKTFEMSWEGYLK